MKRTAEKSTLGKIASVKTVQLFRDGPPSSSEKGMAFVLTVRDLTTVWDGHERALDSIELPHDKEPLSIGQIILPSRGANYHAKLYRGSSKPVFPYGQVNIITPDRNIDAEYLEWYLNREATQSHIFSMLTGTTVQTLTRGRLIELPIVLLDIFLQKKISKISNDIIERQRHFDNITNLDCKLLDNLFQSLSDTLQDD
jgi:hypothetical protein